MGYFKFVVTNNSGSFTFWSNDGTSINGGEPIGAVPLPVNQGIFNVLLGDATLMGMDYPLTPAVFSETDLYLRVWFGTNSETLSLLTPDTKISAVPYALQAENAHTLDGLTVSQLAADYQNLVIVAKSGGDYTSVQSAINSITDAAYSNPYLIWVAPGMYEEQVTMKPHVHLQGAGQGATIITSTASNSVWPLSEATLLLASDTSLRDLTVESDAIGDYNAALLAIGGLDRALIINVNIRAIGSGIRNYAIMLMGSGTGTTLQQVTAWAQNGSERNYGLVNLDGSDVEMQGGIYRGVGGEYGIGIVNGSPGTTLVGHNVTALGENGNTSNYGLLNADGSAAVLYGGSFTGRGGINPFGIANNDAGTTLDADGVTALAENGSGEIYGLGNYVGATATLRGGSFTGRGGSIAYGITNGGNTTYLLAESIAALAENASDANHGFFNFDEAEATLSGGVYTARGGGDAFGITNTDLGSILSARNVTGLCEDAFSGNYALNSDLGATTNVSGGTFTARGGVDARGINNMRLATIFATNVTSLAENGTVYTRGLANFGVAEIQGGSITGQQGESVYGVYNSSSSADLTAERITVLGIDGTYFTYALFNEGGAIVTANGSQFRSGSNALFQQSGSVYLGVSQIDGLVTNLSGVLTCFQVYDGSYAPYTCP